MIKASSKLQNRLVREKSSTGDHLLSKVILLIGNDAGVLHPLAVEFAAYGGDIALASSQLSMKEVDAIRRNVQDFGGRFLQLDMTLFQNILKPETIINQVKKQLGSLDIIIDLSAHKNKKPDFETKPDNPRATWWLSKAILQEIEN